MPDSGAFPDGNIVVNNCSRMNKKLISHCPVFKLCNSITIFWSDVQNESSLRCADEKLRLSGYSNPQLCGFCCGLCSDVLDIRATLKIQKPSVSYRNFFYVRGYVFVLTGNCYEKTIDQRYCACVK